MLVSILIPCFNAERWIGQAIESALSQDGPDIEVIVVDDGSTDGSVDVIRQYGDRVRWESGANRGGNPARNRLLQLARGEWLQYLDADDYLLPGKIARQAEFIATGDAMDVVFGPITVNYWSESASRVELLPIPQPHDAWILLAGWWLPQTGAPLWCKQALLDVGGWKPDQRVCQEHELYLRLLKAGKRFVYCPHNGAVWRVWGTQSVSLRDAARVREQRLLIEQDAEDYLTSIGMLTPERRRAISDARFRMARVAWREGDRAGAHAILASLRRSDPEFSPDFEPLTYRLMWHALGFAATERIAGWRRGRRARQAAMDGQR